MSDESLDRAPRFYETPRGRLILAAIGLVVASFVIGYVITMLLFFPAGRRDVATVPDVRGQTEAEARRTLERAGLGLEHGSSLVHPEAPSGTVLAQSPLPGREVAHGSAVQLTLSAGRERRPVPEVTALNREQARQLLARRGFEVEIEEIEDASRAGTVLQVQPDAGTQVEMPARVRLVVSSGPPPVPVPDVADLLEQGARELLAAAGLRLGRVEYDPDIGSALGEVISQQPAAGALVPPGTQVHVTVSGLPPPPPVLLPPQQL